jgi:phosphatidate cytidylyltransferase
LALGVFAFGFGLWWPDVITNTDEGMYVHHAATLLRGQTHFAVTDPWTGATSWQLPAQYPLLTSLLQMPAMAVVGWRGAYVEPLLGVLITVLATAHWLRRWQLEPNFALLWLVFLPYIVLARVAMAGDYKRFLERTAKIQAGLVVCVYCLSFAAALLHVPIRGQEPGSGANFRLLFFLILLVQFADCMQYVWSRMAGRRPVAPEVSSTRTWEGLLGSATSTALLAAVLWWAAPPFEPWQAALVGFVVAVMGFAGGMTMSAIKRDRGVKDYGTLVVGHGGVLDRVDSMCFAAPVFYHLTVLVAGQ